MDLILHFHPEYFGHWQPDRISEVILNVGWQLWEAVAVPAKHIVLSIGHITKFPNKVFEWVNSYSVGGDAEVWDRTNLVGNNRSGNEVADALELWVHKHRDCSQKIQHGEEVGDSQEVSSGRRSERDRGSVRHSNSNSGHFLTWRLTIPKSFEENEISKWGEAKDKNQEADRYFTQILTDNA